METCQNQFLWGRFLQILMVRGSVTHLIRTRDVKSRGNLDFGRDFRVPPSNVACAPFLVSCLLWFSTLKRSKITRAGRREFLQKQKPRKCKIWNYETQRTYTYGLISSRSWQWTVWKTLVRECCVLAILSLYFRSWFLFLYDFRQSRSWKTKEKVNERKVCMQDSEPLPWNLFRNCGGLSCSPPTWFHFQRWRKRNKKVDEMTNSTK